MTNSDHNHPVTRTMVAPTRRPVRIGNCAGAACDAAYQMLRQCVNGPIDVVTGDYLAGLLIINIGKIGAILTSCCIEANLGANAEKFQRNEHAGFEPNALEGLKLSLDAVSERKIKIIVNGGALNPEGLARMVQDMVMLTYRLIGELLKLTSTAYRGQTIEPQSRLGDWRRRSTIIQRNSC